MKNHILSQLKLSDIEGKTKMAFTIIAFLKGGGRLRIDDDIQGLGPPLCEEQSLVSAGIEPGIRVILEPGTAPSDNQVNIITGGERQSILIFFPFAGIFKVCYWW